MFRSLIRTSNSFILFLLRLTLAVVIFPHGAQKVLGVFGGAGFQQTLEGMSSSQGFPKFLVVMVMLAEFLGSICLALGFIGRFMAFSIFCVMLGATVMVHAQVGFFMNWQGEQQGEGFEFHILAMGIALAIMIGGSGMLSIDRLIAPEKSKTRSLYTGV